MKKMLPYEMKFLVPNFSFLQNPWLGGYRPPKSPFSFSSALNWICWTPPKKIPGYATPLSFFSQLLLVLGIAVEYTLGLTGNLECCGLCFCGLPLHLLGYFHLRARNTHAYFNKRQIRSCCKVCAMVSREKTMTYGWKLRNLRRQ